MKYIFIILFCFCSLVYGQIINKNISAATWVLVYNDTTKQVIGIIDPGHHTETIYQLVEFNSEQELESYIIQNNLIKREEQDDLRS